MFTYRRLTNEELSSIPEMEEIPPSMVGVGAVDEDGKVVACVGIYAALHLSPLWIREDHRKSPSILRRLWWTLRGELEGEGVKDVEVGLLDDNPGPENESTVARIITDLAGGEEVKGRLFVIHL